MHDTDRGPGETATAAPERRTILFDFDGVIIRGDAFASFVHVRLKRARWRLWLALLLALPLLPTLPFTRRPLLRLFVASALVGLSAASYRTLATAFAAELVREPGRFHREALTRLRQHVGAGERVVVVTGCETVLVEAIFAELGLSGVEFLASRLKPGALGMRVAWHNMGARKLVALRGAGIASPWDVAYSDSLHDLPMLREAREAVLVNATTKRCRAAEKGLGRTVARVYWY